MSASRLSGEKGEVIAAVIGPAEERIFQTLARRGADRILHAAPEKWSEAATEAYAQACMQLIEETEAEAVVMGHTALGKDLAPRIAQRLQWGLISDCIDLIAQEDDHVFIRPIYSGKAFQKRRVRAGACFVTIRPNNFPVPETDAAASPNVEAADVEIADVRTRVLDIVEKVTAGQDLSEAKIIVSGGRGVKSKEGFRPLIDLAKALGGVVGASRGACDAGYCDYALQIGQTGKVVTPDLYIACGISGAVQHLAGMSQSKCIVAINKDPDAPIFDVADYGIVGDLFDVVPLLTQELKKAR